MHVIPQSGRISNYYIKKDLAPHVYQKCRQTDVLCNQKWRLITFALVVDDFGDKYIGKQHAYHLIESIIKYYPVDFDWAGGLYFEIKLDWNYYQPRSIDLFMPKYIPSTLHKFQKQYPKIPHNVPHKW